LFSIYVVLFVEFIVFCMLYFGGISSIHSIIIISVVFIVDSSIISGTS